MGHQTSKPNILKYQQHYTQTHKQQHQFLGTILHLDHRQLGTKHFLKIFKFATDHELNLALKKANKRKQLSQKKGSAYIVKNGDIQTDRQNELCGITHYLYVVYQDYHASLGDLIRQRNQSKNFFAEDEVLEFIRNVCNGLIFLQDNGYKNYTITKESVVKGFKDPNSNGAFKVLDTQMAKQMLPYTKILNHIAIQKGTYLAPEALQELTNKNSQPELSLKADIFSLGMVTLEMCLLQPLDNLYNYERLHLKQEILAEKVKNLKNYTPYLRHLIQQMIEINEQQRIGPISLRQKLSINDNKSTTDYGGYSGIGNSNVTQRTHKVSYPLNNTLNVRQPAVLANIAPANQPKINIRYQPDHRIARVVTVDQIKKQNCPPVIFQHNNNLHISSNRKNHTFDQLSIKPQSQPIQAIQGSQMDRYRKRSTQNYVMNQDLIVQDRKSNALVNYPFYVPVHYKPMAPLPFSNNTSTQNGSFRQTSQHQIAINVPLSQPQVPKIQAGQATPNPMNPLPFQPLSSPLIQKPPQIVIPEPQAQQKSQPQTPINNLIDPASNVMFISQPISLDNVKIDPQRKSLIDQLEVLTSLNAGFRKAQSINEDGKAEYESPTRQQKMNAYASNQSTPIRKIQALQSVPRASLQNVIRETEEQNQNENNMMFKKLQFQKNPNIQTQKSQLSQYSGPKTYGRHHFTNGAVYQGQFDPKGNFCGNGVLYYPNGKICYSGGWIDNSFHGFGVLNNEHCVKTQQSTNYQNFNENPSHAWHHYEGQFCMDKKNGFGTLYMGNGDKFSGCFVKDAIEGYGTFTSNKGQRISGIWNMNMLRKL